MKTLSNANINSDLIKWYLNFHQIIFSQAKKYMQIGYERQNEKYRHSDGSYSVWGPSKDGNSQGSMWLTTFVVKAFSQVSITKTS
jgi:hypothetical protein